MPAWAWTPAPGTQRAAAGEDRALSTMGDVGAAPKRSRATPGQSLPMRGGKCQPADLPVSHEPSTLVQALTEGTNDEALTLGVAGHDGMHPRPCLGSNPKMLRGRHRV